jgi:hypothetical protein
MFPRPPSTIATREDLQLGLFVDGAAWVNLFDSIEIWRSRETAQGPYVPLTGNGWEPATLPKGAPPAPSSPATGPLVTLVGLQLLLLVNEETAITITFTGSNPLTYAQVASQIIAQGLQLVTAYVVSNLLVIQTIQPGAIAILRVTGGDAAGVLGFSTIEPASVAFGLDARIPLQAGVTGYTFTDHNGSPHYFYKTRYYNQLTQTVSDFSIPFSGALVSSLASSDLVRATIDLVDSSGVALPNRAILLHPNFRGARVEGYTMVDNEVRALTDSNGHVEFQLVRGQSFTVAISGTDIVRDFITPTDPTIITFDMLDPCLSKNDAFNVAVPNLDYAVRRHL